MTPEVYEEVRDRDRGCLGPRAGMPEPCAGRVEVDHVRASGGLGLRSPSIPTNLASLCSRHHRMKTEAGRRWRPAILDLIDPGEVESTG